MKNKAFLHRFGFAIQGLQDGWRRERSFRTQALIGLIVVLGAALLGISGIWLAVIGLAIAVVLAAELFNSALEALVDHLHPEVHPEIRVVKDMAAAGRVARLPWRADGRFAVLGGTQLSHPGVTNSRRSRSLPSPNRKSALQLDIQLTWLNAC
ncbi:diacylglycerol kinase [Aminobacter sp. MDW-2]|uniref:diacylglycerol kinase n=1 Tax=Aminobacter sp. MDW-2 TaxID=2666139 RepID=UPI0012AFABBF|nr:diacylglycerol kinase [Aminobacter sp. MDW-2]MRX31757.1 diacylglycerol kinase [Aminobacter sp. MDW-2]QNH32237.1 diacylglycerol kinase [Aminobacter sp. MDW-2]